MVIRIKNNSKHIYSLIIAIVLMTPVFICFFRDIFNLESSLVTAIIMVYILFMFFWNILVFKTLKIDIINVIYLAILVVMFLISSENNNYYGYSFLQLGFYVLLPIFLGMQKINGKVVVECIMLLSIPLIFGLNKILVITNVGLNQYDMYTSYAFLVPILASLIHFIYFRKSTSKLFKLCYFLNTIYLTKVLFGAIRGFWLALFIGILIVILLNYKYKHENYKYYLMILLFMIFFIFFLYNAVSVFSWLSSIFENYFNIDVGFFIKMGELLSSGDISNGRNNIYFIIIDFILDNPLIGYGMNSSFLISRGMIEYPHNFILQMFLDLGIILSFLPLYGLFKCVSEIINCKKINIHTIFLIFLIILSLPQSFLSGNMWQNANLWLLIGIGFTKIKLKK